MNYIRIKFTACIFMAILLTTLQAESDNDLREKLARLLMEPGYNDFDNEIFKEDKPQQQHGMILTDDRQKNLKTVEVNFDLSKISETTTEAHLDSAKILTTAKTTEKPPTITMGIARLGSIITRMMDFWSL